MTNAEIGTIENIQSFGLKATLPRRVILELFQQSHRRHLSAEEVFRSVVTGQCDVSLTTVYRVLTQFAEAGLLLRHHFDPNRAVFELNDGHEHDHLVCVQCGCVEEFSDDRFLALQHEIAANKGFDLRGHRFALYGRCSRAECRKP